MRSNEFVEVLIVDLGALEVGHLVRIQGENQLPFGVLPEYGGTFEEKSAGRAVAEVLHSDPGI